MKGFTLIISCVAVISVVSSAETKPGSNAYTSKFNDFDIDAVLNNERVLKNYIKCLLGEGPCTREGRELSRLLPDAIKTECSKCDEAQKAGTVKVLKFLDEKQPEMLKKLLKKFDPTGEYEKTFREKTLKNFESSTSSSTKAKPKPARA